MSVCACVLPASLSFRPSLCRELRCASVRACVCVSVPACACLRLCGVPACLPACLRACLSVRRACLCVCACPLVCVCASWPGYVRVFACLSVFHNTSTDFPRLHTRKKTKRLSPNDMHFSALKHTFKLTLILQALTYTHLHPPAHTHLESHTHFLCLVLARLLCTLTLCWPTF